MLQRIVLQSCKVGAIGKGQLPPGGLILKHYEKPLLDQRRLWLGSLQPPSQSRAPMAIGRASSITNRSSSLPEILLRLTGWSSSSRLPSSLASLGLYGTSTPFSQQGSITIFQVLDPASSCLCFSEACRRQLHSQCPGCVTQPHWDWFYCKGVPVSSRHYGTWCPATRVATTAAIFVPPAVEPQGQCPTRHGIPSLWRVCWQDREGLYSFCCHHGKDCWPGSQLCQVTQVSRIPGWILDM